jgi:hypothetical protein
MWGGLKTASKSKRKLVIEAPENGDSLQLRLIKTHLHNNKYESNDEEAHTVHVMSEVRGMCSGYVSVRLLHICVSE